MALIFVFFIFYQDATSENIPTIVANSSIKAAERLWTLYKETAGKEKLTEDEERELRFGSNFDGFRKINKDTFAYKEDKDKPQRSRRERELALLKNILDFSNGELINSPTMLLAFGERFGRIQGFNPKPIKVVQVIGPNLMLVSINQKFLEKNYIATFLVKGIDTKDIVDGDEIFPDSLFIMSGTYMYTTALGASNKVRVLEPVTQSDMLLAAKEVKDRFGEKWRKENLDLQKKFVALEEARIKELENKKKQDAQDKAAMAQKVAQEKAEAELENARMIEEKAAREAREKKAIEKEKQMKANAAQSKARDSIAKLIRGLESYEQRFEDSFKESKESVMDQMQEQARTYIAGSDKRLEAAIKEMDAAQVPEDEKAKLVDQAKAAIVKAKKKVGLSGPAKP